MVTRSVAYGHEAMKILLIEAIKHLSTAIATRSKSALKEAHKCLEAYKAKPFDESKRDRVPKGQEGGGRWMVGGAAVGARWSAEDGKWVDEKGKALSAKIHKRIEENGKVSKNMIGVKINPSSNPDEVNFAVGYPYNPKTGKVSPKSYIQNRNHLVKMHKEKFEALKVFDKARKLIEKKAYTDAMDGKPAGAIAYIMNATAMRVGSGRKHTAPKEGAPKKPVKPKKSFGACDLLAKHVKVKGKVVTFDFLAKGQKRYHASFPDEQMASIFKAYLLDGNFNDKKPNDRIFKVTADTVNKYLKVTGKNDDLHAHQYRHWKATEFATRLIKQRGKPIDAADAVRVKERVCANVAEVLNNTPEVCYQTYICPSVWQVWGEDLTPTPPTLAHKSASDSGLKTYAYESTRATASFDAFIEETIFPDFEDEKEPNLDVLVDAD